MWYKDKQVHVFCFHLKIELSYLMIQSGYNSVYKKNTKTGTQRNCLELTQRFFFKLQKKTFPTKDDKNACLLLAQMKFFYNILQIKFRF